MSKLGQNIMFRKFLLLSMLTLSGVFSIFSASGLHSNEDVVEDTSGSSTRRRPWQPTAQDSALYAIRIGDLEALRHIVQEEGPAVLTHSTGREEGDIPANTAALPPYILKYIVGRPHILKYIAEVAPEALEAPDNEGYTAAFHVPNVEALQELVRYLPGKRNILNVSTRKGITLAHYFMRRSKLHMLPALQYVVENAPDAHQLLRRQDDLGLTPIDWAIAYGTRPQLQYVASVLGHESFEAARTTIFVSTNSLILAYLSTLPNRDILFGNMSLFCPAAQTFKTNCEAAKEELNMTCQAINVLYIAAMGLTPEQKAAFERGEAIDLTEAQQKRCRRLFLYPPFAALAEPVLEKTRGLFRIYKETVPLFQDPRRIILSKIRYLQRPGGVDYGGWAADPEFAYRAHLALASRTQATHDAAVMATLRAEAARVADVENVDARRAVPQRAGSRNSVNSIGEAGNAFLPA